MGLEFFGLPQGLALHLRHHCSIDTFIETGTYLGDSSAWAARHFPRVVTVEASENLYRRAVRRFADDLHVEVVHGDSGKILADLLPSLKGPSLFWLDSHHYYRDTYGEGLPVPVLSELAAIIKSPWDHFILIDDVSCFPMTSASMGWPALGEVFRALDGEDPGRYWVTILHDALVAVPSEARKVLNAYRLALESHRFGVPSV